MSQTKVTHSYLLPGRRPEPGAQVRVELCTPSFGGDSTVLSGTRWVNLASDGSCALSLDPNTELNPSGTWYEVTDPDGTVWPIVVPVTATPVTLESCLVEAPGITTPVQSGVPLPGSSVPAGYVWVTDGESDGAYAPQTGGGGSGAVSSVAGRTGAVLLVKSDVGLSNVDNTSDANKPVSTAQAAAIAAAINGLINGAPGALDTLHELADAMGDDPNFVTTMTNALAGKLPKPSSTPTAGQLFAADGSGGTTPVNPTGNGELAYAENATGTRTAVPGGFGTNFTDIPGMSIVVPASARPVYLSAGGLMIFSSSGATNQSVTALQITEVSNGVDTPWNYLLQIPMFSGGSAAAAGISLAPKRLGPTARVRQFKLQATSSIAGNIDNAYNDPKYTTWLAAEAR